MVTIKDIADAAGVSIGTVDRIIHNRGRYSEKTAEKVRSLMEELRYTPNIHARGLKNTRRWLFAAVLPEEEQDAGYWRMVLSGISRASDELASFCESVEVYHFDQFSEKSCLDVLKAVLDSEADGLLIAPLLSGNALGLLEETDIPFLFIDSDVPGIKKRIAYIGQDSFQSGFLSGKLMSMMIPENGCPEASRSIMVIEPQNSNYHLGSRVEGFKKYMQTYRPGINLQYLRLPVDSERGFHAILQDTFNKAGKIPDGIFVANSYVYYLASFLKAAGEPYTRVPVIGYDLIPGRESLIEDEIINFILTQQPEQQAYYGIMMLYDFLVLNRTVDSNLIMPLNIITKENLHTFGKKQRNGGL